ncbi:MAG TPA: acyl carrier protein [Streptosporangiaceae bacterium]|jgi:acyl carrier protein
MIPFIELMATVLDVPASAISDDLGPATCADWNSIKHLQIIIAVEDNYQMSFDREEIRAIRRVGDLRRGLRSKGIEP